MVMTVEALRQPISNAKMRPATRPIDLMHLAKQALGDPGLEVEILRMFDETLSVHFAGLEQSTTVAALLGHLHIIKAASVGVGAWSLAEHAHVMETELNAGEPVNPERVDDIHIAVEELRVYIADRVAAFDEELDF
jgi:hypothetical protein